MMDDSPGYVILLDEKIAECPVCYELYIPTLGSKCGHSTCISCMNTHGVPCVGVSCSPFRLLLYGTPSL